MVRVVDRGLWWVCWVILSRCLSGMSAFASIGPSYVISGCWNGYLRKGWWRRCILVLLEG